MTECNISATTADGVEAVTFSGAAANWFQARGIDPETAIGCGVSATGEGLQTVVEYPYLVDGQKVWAQFRGYDPAEKKFKKFWSMKGGRRTFWNVDAIPAAIASETPLLITEGAMDGLSAIEAGHTMTVSVPNGTLDKVRDIPDSPEHDNAFSYMWDNVELLDQVKVFILAGDGDGPGKVLNEELSRRLGVERCKFIEYPEPAADFESCKDLNDVLRQYGPKRVAELIRDAKPYPVKGLHQLSDYPPAGKPEVYSTRIPHMDKHMMIERGRFAVFTGVPGHGKSVFVDNIYFNMAFHNGWHCCIGSFETMPHKGWLRHMVLRYRSQMINNKRPSEQDAIDWVEKHFSFIGQNPTMDEDMDLTLEEMINYAEISVCRYGSKMLLLDPWNEIEHKRRRDETETDYVNRAIREIKRFARRFNVFVGIVAHPTKMTDKGTIRIPNLYDIAGSAAWANKADYGVVVWREDTSEQSNKSTVIIKKVKEQDYMGIPGSVDYAYCKKSSTFDVFVENNQY